MDGDRIVESALAAFGRVDIVINNAGVLRDVSFLKMTQAQWDLIQQIHVEGAFKVTKAAWPHMMKQKFGRIIMTSSAAGLYGSHAQQTPRDIACGKQRQCSMNCDENKSDLLLCSSSFCFFCVLLVSSNAGQANYAAAKLALVGFSNTLAKEGAKNNVFCNAIAPIAGETQHCGTTLHTNTTLLLISHPHSFTLSSFPPSACVLSCVSGSRMTETVLPADFVSALNPEYVAPVVAYLCHDSSRSNGNVYESGAGYVAQVHWQRNAGVHFPIKDASLTPEHISSRWTEINQFETGKTSYPSGLNDTMNVILGKLGGNATGSFGKQTQLKAQGASGKATTVWKSEEVFKGQHSNQQNSKNNSTSRTVHE